MGMRRYISLTLIGFCLSLFIPTSSKAIHNGAGDLVCGQCHTMHSSQGGTNSPSMGGPTGSLLLFRTSGASIDSRGQTHKLCLQCHGVGGAMADIDFQPHGEKAPKVYGGSQINWDQSNDFSKVGAGGDFFMELDSNFDLTSAGSVNALGYGHSVGLVDADPPGFPFGSPFTNDFSCPVCHDPHGVGIGSWGSYQNFVVKGGIGINTYRNLKLYAVFFPPYYGIMSETKSWVGGITGKYGEVGANYIPVEVNSVAIWPVYRDNPLTPENNNVYDGIGVEGMSGFCSQCHIKWHEARAPDYGQDNIAGEDWKRHPVDYVIKNSDISGSGLNTIDWNHYDSTASGYKLPAANTGADLSQEFYYADTDNEDKVFCLSCHFAHGGPYYDNLRWNYTSSVSAGDQTGNGIPSNVGCQLCHNR